MTWYAGRFQPYSYLRIAKEVGRQGDKIVVETMDGCRHVRSPWSLRVHKTGPTEARRAG